MEPLEEESIPVSLADLLFNNAGIDRKETCARNPWTYSRDSSWVTLKIWELEFVPHVCFLLNCCGHEMDIHSERSLRSPLNNRSIVSDSKGEISVGG